MFTQKSWDEIITIYKFYERHLQPNYSNINFRQTTERAEFISHTI